MAARFDFDVFLSHNAQDKPRVRSLAERLRDAGLRVWFDEWQIKAGDDIYLAVERGLQTSRVQLLCLSPAALESDWVGLERSTVLFRDPSNAGRRFIPVLLADCELPDTLRRYRYVDFRHEADSAFAEVLTASQPGEEAAAPWRWMKVSRLLFALAILLAGCGKPRLIEQPPVVEVHSGHFLACQSPEQLRALERAADSAISAALGKTCRRIAGEDIQAVRVDGPLVSFEFADDYNSGPYAKYYAGTWFTWKSNLR